MQGMERYPKAAVERAMKVQEVMLRAMARKITWLQAAEILGMSDRHLRRYRELTSEREWTGCWTGGGAVQARSGCRWRRWSACWRCTRRSTSISTYGKRGVHRKRRPRRPLPGMMLHIDGSRHRWFEDERWYDLLVVLDDATSEIYYAQLVEEESTLTVMAALREVIERKGLFCALYSDRGSHFWHTPKAGGKVDPHRLTQVGRALRDVGVQMIPAYSPQARGRSERTFGTWQGRLPQELRLHSITRLEAANQFLREHYIAEFNQRFQVKAAQPGTAFTRCGRRDLERVFSLQWERTVSRDNTVVWQNLTLQIERVSWRATLAGCNVTVHQHLDGSLSISYGPHSLGQYTAAGELMANWSARRTVEKTAAAPPWKALRASHFPTASTAAGD